MKGVTIDEKEQLCNVNSWNNQRRHVCIGNVHGAAP